MEGLVDLRDYGDTTAHVVCIGKAILFRKPSVAFFQLFNLVQMFEKFPGCPEKIKEDHSKWVAKLLKDRNRRFTTILIILPVGVTVTLDFFSKEVRGSLDDRKAKLRLGELPLSFAVDPDDNQRVSHQLFLPGYFIFRVVPENKHEFEKNVVAIAHEQEKHALADAFGGKDQSFFY
jgi:hypothetical protein